MGLKVKGTLKLFGTTIEQNIIYTTSPSFSQHPIAKTFRFQPARLLILKHGKQSTNFRIPHCIDRDTQITPQHSTKFLQWDGTTAVSIPCVKTFSKCSKPRTENHHHHHHQQQTTITNKNKRNLKKSQSNSSNTTAPPANISRHPPYQVR